MSIMRFHLGWRANSEQSAVRWVWWLPVFCLVEAAVTIFGDRTWNWQNAIVGLLFFLVILAANKVINYIPWTFFRSQWWIERYRIKSDRPLRDFALLQFSILVLLVCGATAVGWCFRPFLGIKYIANSSVIFLLLLISLAFVSVAIACWTTLPQVAAIDAVRQQAESLFLKASERYDLVMQGANEGLWDWNLENHEIYFSQRWKAMLGYADDEIASTLDEWRDRIHPDDKAQFQLELSRHLDGTTSHFEREHRILHKDGTYRWVLSRGLAVRNEEGQAYRIAGSQTDITDRHRAEAQLSHDALHDRLTGLPNRILFQERLEHVLQLAKRHNIFSFAVLFVDLDRFKTINDSLGHLVGDRLLMGIAQRLKACIRSSDTLARLGGDEFAMLIEDVDDKGDIIHLVERIQQEFKLPFHLNGQEIYANASIGVLIETADYDCAEDLLRDADIAMYRAKERGRGCYEVFDITMRDRAVAMLHLETDLRKAIINQEFQLHYQPIVALHNNQITGFEALVRWQHPDNGLIPPIEFIGVAEETGLILPLGIWVLQEACTQMRAWHEEFPSDPPLSVSVNVSGKQFAQVDLVDKIRQILVETSFDPHCLKLEITESTIVEDLASAKAKLIQLQELGIQVSIDDFGTGYSSLSYLSRFPINFLKIDRSFIQDIDTSSERLEIIRAIVSLADSLKIDVVAEGVETASQLAQLCSLQPTSGQEHFAQGYLFSKPLNRDAAKSLIASGRDCYASK
ncbi:putative bifunctional diguanylate cyclase/phosphodiesterase [Chroococcidiopsis thermalis]|uniref:Diguanylate cyclase/phosphodiesterase with PAS/PAC sensor(S) n=1 Tax=Chroococcidiopsis thermalis (strain PCC 7203) TaxID=251229 RepID=K9U5H0_CHRTP|nr:GGDEF domain-containing phosphodiesterase [Chroococcidiopsis thermalis]AFY89499.1 diguanylate cyclase/phosphodiesterase with PAS/PAC sensor(s) [Chroococcidiopsis thermalis PCC 7203]